MLGVPPGRFVYTLKNARPGERLVVQVIGISAKGPRQYRFQDPGGLAPAWYLQFFHSPVELGLRGHLYKLPPNTMVPVEIGQALHYGHPKLPWVNSYLRASGYGIGPLWDELGLKHGTPLALGDGKAFLQRLFSIHHEMEAPRGPNPHVVWGLFIALCAEAVRGRSPKSTAKPDAPLEAIRHEMARHPERPWHMARTAAELGWSAVAFHRAFFARFGRTPGAFLLDLRMKRAAELLLRGKGNLSQIGDACGYPDPFHFSRVFKGHFGRPPSVFRREVGGI
ncbi:MAG: helix-turn-helix transcriptional regulator [Spirochaetes bacterium]|nr:helix-turn-helix transcriptional regulator [Spirochaetota bacterium]